LHSLPEVSGIVLVHKVANLMSADEPAETTYGKIVRVGRIVKRPGIKHEDFEPPLGQVRQSVGQSPASHAGANDDHIPNLLFRIVGPNQVLLLFVFSHTKIFISMGKAFLFAVEFSPDPLPGAHREGFDHRIFADLPFTVVQPKSKAESGWIL
jgi:hypothetical protein